ncbi:ABC transporter ATP-binding protein [Spiroplasma sp. BIUS-1]|uniref:ABC transporter ATP-binding protein n=1 Tax=Spiroplasma sp. BIUS-1 TaxID=216964 RepID=UPI0013979270|nr:ABC transporter ATP-binding protein [Spiroplasma sp. BIUS-1]QHX36335.1 general nucleoside transport system ATP-binding protein [Spiroplasma sp. BIUS-1]
MAKYAIEMEDISMIFNQKIIANQDINFKVEKGEIHCLVGENGAGKSTLMSILFGIYQPTKGTIKVNGREEIITSPIKATKLGIGMVHQHFKLIDILPIWKNICLGSEEVLGWEFMNKKAVVEKTTELMKKYNLEVDLDAKVQNISVGMKQRVEILKILYKDVDILVFDEPTAVLTPQEIDGLLDVMLEFKKIGKTIIFITHKFAEIEKVADKATVIRKGKYVGTFDVKKSGMEEISKAMVGRTLVEVKNTSTSKPGDVVIKFEDINVKKHNNNKVMGLKDFNLEIREGEIIAIAGVEGNGQNEIAEVLSGLVKPASGKIYHRGEEISKTSISKRYLEHKMSFIPEDRHKHGLVLDENIINNTPLQDISTSKYSKAWFVNFAKVQNQSQRIIKDYDVRNADAGFTVTRNLSGGNQQKVIIGRELTRENDFIIIFQPTRGLDLGSIEFIHQQILKAKEERKAILLISYELSEVMQLADKVVVVNSGQIVGQVDKKEATREKIGQLMTSNLEGGSANV